MKLNSLPKAYGKNIIVKLDKPETKSDGGIILTESLSKFSTGEVVSIADCYCSDLIENSEDIEDALIPVGSRIMFVSNGFYGFEFEGGKYVVLRFSEVLATL